MERFFHALVGSALIDSDRWEWGGEFGSATCPVCEQRNFLYFKDTADGLVVGCRDRCDRLAIIHAMGLDGFDLLPSRPKWIRGGKLGHV